MKKILLSIALAFLAPFAWAQVSETTTTTTTTDANGTITEYTPDSAIGTQGDQWSSPISLRQNSHLRDAERPRAGYRDLLKTRIKVGVPVRLHSSGTGDNMVVDRVIVDED